jgi:hypothetical protein
MKSMKGGGGGACMGTRKGGRRMPVGRGSARGVE